MWKERVFSKLLTDVIPLIEHEGKALKNTKVIHDAESWVNLGAAGAAWRPFKHVDLDTVWMITTAYGKGALCSIAIILFIIFFRLIKNRKRWRRARVFLSYQHRFEDIAITIV